MFWMDISAVLKSRELSKDMAATSSPRWYAWVRAAWMADFTSLPAGTVQPSWA